MSDQVTEAGILTLRDDTDALLQLRMEAVEQALVNNDLSKLNTEERVAFVRSICDDLGLNWKTQPFQYIVLNNKLTLYARRDACDQLRRIYNVSIEILDSELIGDHWRVRVRATMPNGRADEATSLVVVKNMKSGDFANAVMKCETKAKRRVTLSICGLGFLDESEVEDMHTANDQRTNALRENSKRIYGLTIADLREADIEEDTWRNMCEQVQNAESEDVLNEMRSRLEHLPIILRADYARLIEQRSTFLDAESQPSVADDANTSDDSVDQFDIPF